MRARALPPGPEPPAGAVGPASPDAGPPPRRLARTRDLAGRAFPELRPPLTPFGRLAVTHLLMVTGDAFMTVALAGSLFFSISPSAARSKVVLYLLLTMAPFAVVAPALGPLLDRSREARRVMVMSAGAVRVVLCFFMARDLHSLLFFPEAFLVLVASKLYLVGKAALVPAVADSGPGLVRANSRLALISALAGLVGGAPAVAILKIPHLGAPWVLRVDAVVFLFAALSAARLPRTPSRSGAAPVRSEAELDTDQIPAVGPGGAVPVPRQRRRPPAHSPASVVVASTAMAVMRGTVGLVTFLLAFELRRQHAATWWYGVVLVASVAGSLVATLLTPVFRRVLSEERILVLAMALVMVASAGAFALDHRLGDCVLVAGVGLGAASAKLAFDSLVQRDVPEAGRGRAFAAFETRFQLAWVIGSLVPVVITISDHAGELVVLVLVTVIAFLYLTGRHTFVPAVRR
ncbi:MAG: MFS transporter [Acidimicrobiales bacterium]